MSKPVKVAILGTTGMLGGMVLRYLSTQPGYFLTVIERDDFDVEYTSSRELIGLIGAQDYVVNCIGQIKPRIDESDPWSVQRAIRVNALFPHLLAAAAEGAGCRVLQIATDCVYSGQTGGYDETAPHDPADVYGKTKSLGEVRSPAVRHLRCSIIGPEGAGRPRDSLLEWFLGQGQGAQVSGYTNHRWNGVTTLAFARLCHGIMQTGLWETLPPVQHIVPYIAVTKAGLLSFFSYFYKRDDVNVGDAVASVAVDRTLSTDNPNLNEQLWQASGYQGVPTIFEMVKELAAYQ
jgi:dTDP-4-dehydrorhamnose reductase